MTGRHKLRTGVWHTVQGRSLLHREETTMAEVFREEGYRTGIFGKWHLGDNAPYRPQDRGFESVFVHGGGGVMQTPDYWGNDYYDDTYFRDGDTPEDVEGYCTDVWFDEATTFVEDAVAEDDPFFCYLPTNAAHAPFQVPDEYSDPYLDDVDDDLANFFGMVANIDENIGRLRNRLDELGVAEDTILVFFGDNGTVGISADHYNAGMRGNKGSHYEGGHRVHSFVHWPDRFEDRTVDALTAHYDLLPTFASVCGLDLPDAQLDGEDLTSLLEGEADSWSNAGTGPEERTLFVDTQRVERPEQWRNSAVLAADWRLIDGEELYRIDEDPGQTTDVSDDHPDVVADLRERYESWWDDVADRFEDYCRIDVGIGDPVTLTAHDWHEVSDGVPWNQPTICRAPETNGFWTLSVEEAGTYEIELRRWPREADTAIDDVPEGFERLEYSPGGTWSAEARTVDPDTAAIEIGDRHREQSVPDGANGVTFTLDLDPGPTECTTWFREADGTERGAYYAYVSRAE
jgi:arylsulfatase A-like enzyme